MFHKIHFFHVKGHSLNEWNELADYCAKQRGAAGEINNPCWKELAKLDTYYKNWMTLGELAAENTESNLVRDDAGKPCPNAKKPEDPPKFETLIPKIIEKLSRPWENEIPISSVIGTGSSRGNRFKIGGEKKKSITISGPLKETENMPASNPVHAPAPGPPPRLCGGFDDLDDWGFGEADGNEGDSYADIDRDEVGAWM